ncbi:MAG TPA: fibronectin type III domain-containing protein, partial [Desulfosporosinus sp.]|nr:fibronectin type III domain-containing protein [Desulfosporosinus sp.]
LLCFIEKVHTKTNVLAVFSLRPTNIEAMDYSGDILYTLISVLEKEEIIEVMSRRQMEEILFQQGLSQGDNPDQVIKAGNALGVNFVIFGNVTAKGGQVQAELKLMDIPSKRTIDTWSPVFSGREAIKTEIAQLVKAIESKIANRDSVVASESAEQTTQEVQIDIENLHASLQDGKVVLRWKFDPSQPIVGFNIYRSKNKAGPYQFLRKTKENIFTDSGLNKSQLYFYTVGILLGSGQEIKSKQVTEITYTTEKMPHPPLIMGGSGHVRCAAIEFVPSMQNDQENFEIVQYKIYRQSDDGEWAHILSLDEKKSSRSKVSIIAEDKKISDDDKICTYALSNLDKDGKESPLSDPIEIRTVARPTLSLEKDNLLREIHLTWAPVKNVEGYNLYRQSDQKDWEKIERIRGESKTSFIDKKGLDDEKVYQYHLTCYDKDSETGPSNQIEAKTKDLPPFPQNTAAQDGLVKSVQISWEPVDDLDIGGYAIYRGLDANSLDRITMVKDHKSHTYLDKGKSFTLLEDGKTYYYNIASYNLFKAEGEPSSVIQATTKPRPTSVKGFRASVKDDQIIVQWDPNPESDIKNYTLYRNKNSGQWSKITELDSGQSDYYDQDLKPDVIYSYRIIVEDKDGLESDPVESESIQSPIVKTE